MNSGYLETFLYCLFTAISFNFIDKLDDHINPLISLSFMSIVATLFFNTITYKHTGKMLQAIINNKIPFFLMSLSISINWLCSIYAPNLSDSFIYITLYSCTLALLGFVFIKKSQKIDYYINYSCAAIFFIILYILHMKYVIGHDKNLNIGFYFGILSGISGYAYGYTLNIFVKKSALTTNQTLAVRFWVLIILLIFITLKRKLTIHLSYSDLGILLFMSIFTMIIPNYLNQSSIIKLGIAKRSILVTIIPFLTFSIYSIYSENFNVTNFTLAVTITLVMILSKIIPYKMKR